MFKRFSALLLAAALGPLGGCASNIPELIRTAPDEAVDPPQVQAEPSQFEGRRVRWGGEVIETTNEAGMATIEILARPLWPDGPPHSGAEALGRFLARVEGFVDPVEYAPGETITITGKVVGAEVRNIGDHPYTYPLVETEARHLWPRAEIAPNRYYYSPFHHHRPWGPPPPPPRPPHRR